MTGFIIIAAIKLCLGILFHLHLKPLFLNDELGETITLLEHIILNIFTLRELLLEVFIELLLLQHLVCALFNPVLDSVDIDTLFVVFHLFFLFAALSILTSLLLQRLQLVNFLRHKLVSFLQIILQLEHSLVFVLDRLLVRE